jgi:hypothetical protein
MALFHTRATAMISALDLDSKVESFNSIMTDVLDRYVPLKILTYYESSIASGDVELRLLIERRELAYPLWRSRPSCRSTEGNFVISVIKEKFLEKQRRSFGAI